MGNAFDGNSCVLSTSVHSERGTFAWDLSIIQTCRILQLTIGPHCCHSVFLQEYLLVSLQFKVIYTQWLTSNGPQGQHKEKVGPCVFLLQSLQSCGTMAMADLIENNITMRVLQSCDHTVLQWGTFHDTHTQIHTWLHIIVPLIYKQSNCIKCLLFVLCNLGGG